LRLAIVRDNAMTTSTYHPISCEFHDRLEDLATLRKPAQVRYRDQNGVLRELNAVIKDVFAKDGEEFMLLSTGETLRLDQLVEVDGEKLADYGESSACALPEPKQ
jgi:Rho-binding antiterminator